jgi:hypothetical protein
LIEATSVGSTRSAEYSGTSVPSERSVAVSSPSDGSTVAM